MVAAHCFVTANDVFEDGYEDRPVVRASGRERRAVVEDELRLVLIFDDGTVKGVVFLPPFNHPVLKGGKMRA
jgi:hypothetical protein